MCTLWISFFGVESTPRTGVISMGVAQQSYAVSTAFRNAVSGALLLHAGTFFLFAYLSC
jgi:hypothetical protein